jgi:RNA polymerase sigma factor (sigma-70 family)
MKDDKKESSLPGTLERKLIKRTLAGDNTAFTELMKQYYRIYFALALRYTHDLSKAEDVLQDGWMEIYQSLPSLENPDKFGSWGYTIIRRKCIKDFKDIKEESKAMMNYTQEQKIKSSLENRVVSAGTKQEQIVKAISELPRAQREIVVLHFFQEMNCDEISERLDLPLNTVYVYIHRAKLQLKELLKELK